MSASNALISPLFEGPIDIVGDVHGESALLRRLLEQLGYDGDGEHPRGRRLVFIGDLVDRGPDSPAVAAWVRRLVERGAAQCLLGNHELNIAEGKRREGNGWFRGDPSEGGHFEAAALEEGEREGLIAFFASLPVALERHDLRLVHAAWHGPSVEALRPRAEPWRHVYGEAERAILKRLAGLGVTAEVVRALEEEHGIRQPGQAPPWIEALAVNDVERQMGNPVRVLVSGFEAPTVQPFYVGGRWRMVERVRWWDGYDEEPAVLVGHFWRSADPARFVYENLVAPEGEAPGVSVFDGMEPFDWFGARRNVFCVDYCAGALWKERKVRPAGPLHGRLAAMRVPEWELVTDDGIRREIGPPG